MFTLFALIAQGGGDEATAAAGGLIGGLCGLIIGLFIIVSLWKVFTKAGKPGWAAIIPIYNFIVILEIVGRPIWWIILMLIPGVSFIVLIILMIDLAKSFGKGTGFGLGLAFLSFIFLPLLGFGDARYVGPMAGR